MILKKLNAISALLATLSLCGHLVIMTRSLFTGWYNFSLCKGLAHATMCIVIFHVFLSAVIMFFLHDGTDMKKYAGQNISTVIQRASALIGVVFLHMHVRSYTFMATHEVLSPLKSHITGITEVIFVSAILVHVAVSLSKVLISLGIVSSNQVLQRVNKIVYAICLILGIAAATAILRFFF